MKKKLIISNILIVFFALFTLLISSFVIVSNSNYKKTTSGLKEYLNITCNIYDGSNQNDLLKYFEGNNNIRITIIDKSGNVLFDNESSTEENHLTREEIAHLGKISCRYSSTLHKNMYYIASEDSNNYVRIAIPESDANIIIRQLLIYGSIVLIFVLILSIIISSHIIKKSLLPLKNEINKLSLIAGQDINYVDADISVLSNQVDEIQTIINKNIQEIQNEKNKTLAIIDDLNQGFILLDDNLNVILINKTAKKVLNYNDEITYLYFIRSLDLQKAIENVKNLKIAKTIEISENGSTYIYQISILNYQELDTSKYGILIFFYDISKEHQLQVAKQDFFANASHELKSPLTSIIGYQQMIIEGIIDNKEEIIDACKRTMNEAKRMNEMVIDMLNLSSLESEKISNNETNDLADVTKKIIESYKIKSDSKNIVIVSSLESLITKIPEKDLIHLISNLIDNSIKYSNNNSEINIKIADNLFVIKDQGIGISKANQTRVFERFYQVDKTRTTSQGSGLGLSIVKHICLKYDIKLNLESKLNKGTTITLEFPSYKINNAI